MFSERSKYMLQILISVLIGFAVFFFLLITVTIFAAAISSSEVGIIALIAVGVAYVRHRVYRRRTRLG